MRVRTTWNREQIARAGDKVRLRKAELAIAAARLMLPDADAEAVEDQAVALMYLSDDELIATHRRLSKVRVDEPVGDDDEPDDDGPELDDIVKSAMERAARLEALELDISELRDQVAALARKCARRDPR